MKTLEYFLMKKKYFWFILAAIACILAIDIPVEHTNTLIRSVTFAQSLDSAAQKIAVMPLLQGKRPEDIAEMLNCPLERMSWSQNALAEGAEKILTQMVQKAAESRFGEKIAPLSDLIDNTYPISLMGFLELQDDISKFCLYVFDNYWTMAVFIRRNRTFVEQRPPNKAV